MNSKRSYIDTVNAGRQRRSYTSLEQLNKSLETLEQKLGRDRDARAVAEDVRPLPELPTAPARPQQYDAVAKDMQRVRREEDGVAAFGKISAEITSLHEELRQNMRSGLREEFDSVREKFHRINARSGHEDIKLGLDVERLTNVINSFEDRNFETSDTGEAVDFSRHSVSNDNDIIALNARVDQISRAVGQLSETLPLQPLEDKVRTLASALNHFIEHQDGRTSELFTHIEERLDEISRAIVGATVARRPHDPEPFERIEARISALSRQIEEITVDREAKDPSEQLQVLIERVDELAARSALPEEAIDQLAHHISVLAEKVVHTSAPLEIDDIVEAIDRRFASLAKGLENEWQGANGKAVRNLEGRLDDISRRLDQSASQFATIDPELLRSLEAQIAALADHLSKPSAPLPEFVDISPRLQELERSIAESREAVLETARAAAQTAVLSLADRQPDTSSDLAREVKALDELTRRSDERNSKTFEAIHDTLVKIADRMGKLEQNSAPQAVIETTHSQASQDIDAASAGFGNKADQAGPKQAKVSAAAKIADEENDHDQDIPAVTVAATDVPELGAGRARSMLGNLTRVFSRQAGKQKDVIEAVEEKPSTQSDEAKAPEIEPVATIDPVLANQPLEPGSGTPDLNAILKRVRDERAPMLRETESDAGKSDFIAAARRAAQAAAAAADAEGRKRKADKGSPSRFLPLGRLLHSRRTHLLLGATALVTALAALHFGKSMIFADESARHLASVESVQNPIEAIAAEKPAAQQAKPAPLATSDVSASDVTQESIEAQFAPYKPEQGSNSETVTSQGGELQAATLSPERLAGLDEPSVTVQTPIGPAALREAAEAGDRLALFEVGSRYAEGRGVGADMAEAAKWYEQSAEAGFAPAQYLVGNMYEKGLGVQRDLSAARRWYELAANAGNASAMHNLAVLYAMGIDGQAHNDDAARWFIKAAELGVKDSQFNLGILSAKGAGTPQSLEESYKWFALVSQTGDKDAERKRDEIGKALRPEQLQRARAAADLWKPRPLDAEANVANVPEAWLIDTSTTAGISAPLAVKSVQQMLNEKGYDAGSADGKMGSKTRDAIAQFQADNGLTPTGKVDESLARVLTAVN